MPRRPKSPKPPASKKLAEPLSKFRREIRDMFGARLKAAREEAGYEHAADFAKVLGIEENRYRHYERGSAEPGFELFVKICQILDVEPNDLLPFGKRRKQKERPHSPTDRVA